MQEAGAIGNQGNFSTQEANRTNRREVALIDQLSFFYMENVMKTINILKVVKLRIRWNVLLTSKITFCNKCS